MVSLGNQPMVVTLLLYALISIEPSVADVEGGTRLRVAGEGLRDLNYTECLFAGGLRTPATLLNATTVTCEAPRANASSEGCAGEAVELQLLPGLSTSNGIGLRRVNTPSVTRVSPARGYYIRPQWVRVVGYGFMRTPYLSCLFSAGASDSVVVSGPEAVQYVSTTEVLCRQPAVPVPMDTHLEVSIDGQKFSRSNELYAIVGPPVAIHTANQALNVEAAEATRIASPALEIFTQDVAGHRVLGYDTGRYPCTAWVQVAGRTRALNTSGAAANCSNGTAVFGRLTLSRPKVGLYDLFVKCGALGPLPAPVKVTVAEGVPVALAVVQEPSDETLNSVPLTDQPRLQLRDSADNPVLNPNVSNLRVRAEVVPAEDRAFDTIFGDGGFKFGDVRVVAGHGVEYHLRFSLWPVEGLRVANATSRGIRARPCAQAEYYIRGRAECFACPVGAECNSTDVLLTQANYWRSARSVRFLRCSPEALGEAGPPCEGGRTAGACSRGFTGPLCAVCEAGRAGAACRACGRAAVGWLIIGGLCLLFAGLIGVTTYKAFLQDHRHYARSTLALDLKVAVTYLQTIGILAPILPKGLREGLQTAGGASSIQLPTDIVACVLPFLTTYNVYYITMALPLLGLVVALCVFWYDSTLGCRPFATVAAMHPAQQDKTRHRSFTRGRPFLQILLVSLSVMLYFLYPSLIQQSPQLNECVTKDFGCVDAAVAPAAAGVAGPDACSRSDLGLPSDGRAHDLCGEQSFLAKDFGISCTSPVYYGVRGTTFVFILTYGFGVPLAFVVVGQFLRKRHAALEVDTFAFLMAGFRREFRYWETLTLLRKFLVIFVVTFVPDPRLRIYASMWLMLAFLILHYVFQPFERAAVNNLETVCLLVLTLTLNLSLLWLHPYLDASRADTYIPALETGLFVVMVLMQVFMAACFALAFFSGFREFVLKHVRVLLRRHARKRLQLQVLEKWKGRGRASRCGSAEPDEPADAAVTRGADIASWGLEYPAVEPPTPLLPPPDGAVLPADVYRPGRQTLSAWSHSSGSSSSSSESCPSPRAGAPEASDRPLTLSVPVEDHLPPPNPSYITGEPPPEATTVALARPSPAARRAPTRSSGRAPGSPTAKGSGQRPAPALMSDALAPTLAMAHPAWGLFQPPPPPPRPAPPPAQPVRPARGSPEAPPPRGAVTGIRVAVSVGDGAQSPIFRSVRWSWRLQRELWGRPSTSRKTGGMGL